MARDCTVYENVQTIFIPLFLAWLLVLVLWVYNTFWLNRQSANNLHKMLTWLPAVECVYTFLCIFYYVQCPWDTFGATLNAAALLMVVILKEPLNLLCLLLVAKGWCITRDSLAFSENRIIVISVVLLYAAVVFEIFSPANASGVFWMIPLIIAYIVMLVNTFLSTWTNLRILKSQLLAMAQLNIDPLSTPAYAKFNMFKRLILATACYVAMELMIHITTSVLDMKPWIFLFWHQLMELLVFTFIGVQFRARPINSVFQQMQAFGLQLAEQLLPSVTTISINMLELSAPGMVEWSDKMMVPPEPGVEEPPMQLIVVNPGADDSSDASMRVQTAVCSQCVVREYSMPTEVPVAAGAPGAAAFAAAVEMEMPTVELPPVSPTSSTQQPLPPRPAQAEVQVPSRNE
mmetsp:Transcript_43572/g.107801  ORF Transcript_43572/g.107801 Transcript_43572/m.107801 type:complete len:403 (+) Transcript_43572:85-1293(+)